MSEHPAPWHLGDKAAIYDADSGYVTRLSSRELAEEIIDAVNAGGGQTGAVVEQRAALTDVTREPCAEALCPEIFRETGQRCDKPDDGHTKHTYELWEHGVQVELAAWDTPR